MNTAQKMAAGTVLGGAMLVAGGLSLAHAAPTVPEAQTAGDAKVNVTLTAGDGDRIGILQDVSIANAVSLVSAVCPISGITEANLNDLDVSGTAVTQTCGGMGGLSFTFSQNGPGNSDDSANGNGNGNGNGQDNANRGASQNAPGQTKAPVEGEPPSATPPSTPVGQQGR